MKKIIFTSVFALGIIALSAQPALKVASDGNVGIGIAVPTNRLHVKGNVTLEPPTGNDNSGIRGLTIDSRIQLSNSTTNLSSQAYVTMNGPSINNGSFLFNAREIRFHVNKADGNFGDWKMTLTQQGRLGINTTTPTFDLEVNGTAGKTGGGEFQTASDKRLKKNVDEYTGGLKEILKINPVTFQYNGKGGLKNNTDVFVGVIAQEFQQVEPEMVKPRLFQDVEYNTVSDPSGSEITTSKILSQEEYLTVDASNIKYMLVNAIKEQQVMIKELQESNKELVEQMSILMEQLSSSSKVTNVALQNQGSISQNIPNPFNTNTLINYIIPENSLNARVDVFNMNGVLINTIKITNSGAGSINLNATDLPSGNYIYNLVIDNKIMESKKMIKTQ